VLFEIDNVEILRDGVQNHLFKILTGGNLST